VPVEGVVVTDAELDHTLGLACCAKLASSGSTPPMRCSEFSGRIPDCCR
jgi:hypothetical protein